MFLLKINVYYATSNIIIHNNTHYVVMSCSNKQGIHLRDVVHA